VPSDAVPGTYDFTGGQIEYYVGGTGPFIAAIGGDAQVVIQPELVSVEVTPANPSIALGLTQQFTATGTYSDASTADITATVTWTSGTPATATIGAATGLATSVAEGTTLITATQGAISGNTTLTVTAKELVSIAVTPADPSIALGLTQQFTATGTYTDASTADITGDVTWTSGTPATATIAAGGLATSVAEGTSVITATLGAISGNTTLTVGPIELVSIAVTPADPTVLLPNTQQFTATGTYTDASTADITGAVTWTSGTLATATIGAATGLAQSVAAGTTTITATLGAISGNTTMTVITKQLVSIEVLPAGPSIALGDTQQFAATGTYTDASTADLTATANWTSSVPGVATIGLNTGLATSVSEGGTIITATSGAISGNATLTVTAKELVRIAVIPAGPSIALGRTRQFTATGTYTDASQADLTNVVAWTSGTPATATVAAGGLATSVAVGTTTITATQGAISGNTTLTVTAPELDYVMITPDNPEVAAGETIQFALTEHYSDGSTVDRTADATWTSGTPAAATIETTGDANPGLATGVAAGPTTIQAVDGANNDTTVLTVVAPTLVSVAIDDVYPAVAPVAIADVPDGTNLQLSLTGTDSAAGNTNLTASATGTVWASLDLTIATISTEGVVTGVAPGTVTIRATNSGISDEVQLNVVAPVLTGITVTPAAQTITVGATLQYTATGTYSDGSTADVTATVTWTSSVPGTATIDAAGLATGVAAGATTTVTATLGAVSGNTTLDVTAATLTGITVTPANPTINAGDTQQFTATGHFDTAPDADITGVVTWTSGTPAAATIDAAGLATGVAAGTSTMTATLGAVSGNTLLTVNPPVLVSIAVTPANPSVVDGLTQQFTATGTYTDGSTADITATVVWTSGTPGVATIDAAGLATGVAAGTSVITATSGAISGNTTLTVTPAELVSIAVTPADPTIAAGNTQQFTATGTYTDGTTPVITGLVTWTSADTGVAGVDNAGLATGLSVGTTTITATLGTISGSTGITVTEAVLTGIAVTPVNQTITDPGTLQYRAIGTYSDGTTADVTATATWTSGTPATATISAAGLATSAGAGGTVITATIGAVSGNTNLTVTAATMQTIIVTPAGSSVAAGNQQQFTATATFDADPNADITAQVTWSSSDTGVATIVAGGLAQTYQVGTTTITATLGAISGNTTLTATAAVVVSVTVTPVNPSIAHVDGNPAQLQFVATANYSDGTTADITATANWTSGTPVRASIAAGGLATTASAGTTTITATDPVSAQSDNTLLTVLADTVAPVVTLDSPTDGLVLTDKSLTIAGSVDDVNAAVTAIVNGNAVALAPVGGILSEGVLLKTGSNTIVVRAVDGAGNIGTSGTVTVEVNPNKPTVTITSPQGGLLTNDPSVTIAGTVTNATAATLILNGVPQAVTLTNGAFSVVKALTEGTNVIVVNAYATGHAGDADYLGTSGMRTVELDTTGPSVVIDSPASSSVVGTAGVTVSGTVDDPGVSSVLLVINGGAPKTVPVVAGQFSQNVTLVPGLNTMTAAATDAAGNTSSTATPTTITFDNTKPTVTVTAPANMLVTKNATQAVIGTVSDPSITQATVYVNGAVQKTISVAPDGSFNATALLIAGSNTVEVRASDGAGNTGTSGSIAVTVDTTAPVLTIGLSDPTDSIAITVGSSEALAAAPTVTLNPVVAGAMTKVGVNRWSGTYSPIAVGQYTVTVAGTDKAGNTTTRTATFAKAQIDVDGVDPTTVSTADTTLEVETVGAVTNADISVTTHLSSPSGNAGNPAGADASAGAFVEIVASPELRDNLSQVYIRVDYDPADLPEGTDESSLRLYLWDVASGTWKVVPGSGVNTVEKFIYGTVDHLSEFGAFGTTGAAPPTGPIIYPPPDVEEEEEAPVCDEGPGVTCLPEVDAAGQFAAEATAGSQDAKAQVTVPAGTIGLTAEGEPLTGISVTENTLPPPAPADHAVVALTYNFGPEGATFDTPVSITLTYSEADLPAGAEEEDLKIAVWNELTGEWDKLASSVDATNNTITAQVSHFSTFTVLVATIPASLEISGLTVTPDEVGIGEDVSISVVVRNSGDLTGTYTVELKVNDEVVETKHVSLGGGESVMVYMTVSEETDGVYAVDVNGLTGKFTVTAPPEVVEPTEADIATSNLSVTPALVETGETVTISVRVANRGGQQGTRLVELRVDGVVVETERVTLAAGASQTVTFTTSQRTAGIYLVDVDGLTDDFTVETPEVPPTPGPNWPLIGGIIGGVVLIALIAGLLLWRRRTA